MPPAIRLSPRYMTKGESREELLGDQHGVGEAERGLLLDVGHPRAEARAVAHRGADLLPVSPTMMPIS